MKFTRAKTIWAAIGTVVTVVTAVFADNVLDVGEVGTLVSAAISGALTIYAVYRVPNGIIANNGSVTASADEYSDF